MPTEWTYHADGVDTAVRTTHDLDGTLTNARIQLDCFKTREWSEEEAEDTDAHLFEGDEPGTYVQHGDGRHATLRYGVTDGVATLQSIEPEDGDRFLPGHMALIRASERVLGNLDGVESLNDTVDSLVDAYEGAEGIYIDQLDG